MKKKIVVINDFPIYPVIHGGKIRIYNIYKELSKFYDVTYICFGNCKKVEIRHITEDFIEISIPKSLAHRTLEAIAAKLLNVSIADIVSMFLCKYDLKLNSTIKNCLSNCDIVVSLHPYMYPAIKKQLRDEILIYESFNVEHLLKKSILGKGLFRNLLCNYVKQVEKEIVMAADLVFAVSTIDMDMFERTYGINSSKIHLSPNGVDIPAFDILYKNNTLVKSKIVARDIAIFFGSAHPPNVEAVKTIIYEIAPKMNDIYFLICGSVCWLFQKEKVGKNVGLTSVVSEDEKLELYRVSDIALNPMLSGAGTNIKMLEYMAAGLPVITTPTGARGLDVENNFSSIICEISDFPERISEVLSKKDYYDKISCNGRKLVEEKYDWKKIAENMAIILEGNLGEK